MSPKNSIAVGSFFSDADQNSLGDTMAHKAGHFLGLFHTNESSGASVTTLPNMTKDPLIEILSAIFPMTMLLTTDK
ncbi:hypothetical protein AB3N59_15960 [Leptospira sp. WS92.C1]